LINIEVDLEEYYEKFKFFIENVNDLIYVVDPNDNFTIKLINEQVHNNLLGYNNINLINRSILDFIHPEDTKTTQKILKRGTIGAGKLEEVRIKDINGTYICFEFKVKKFEISKNKKQLLIIAKDISEKKYLESKLEDEIDKLKGLTSVIPEIRFWKLFNPKKYEEAFRFSNKMLQNVIDNIPVSIFWKDTNLTYLGCNDNYAKLIGAAVPENIIGEMDHNLFSNNEKVDQLHDREIKVMKTNFPEYHIVESRTLRDGKEIWLDINRIPLHDSEGNTVGLLVTYEDITERKKAEEQLRDSEMKFRKVFEAIPDIYFLVSNNSTILDYKGKSKDLYLFPKEFLGNKLIDFMPKEIREIIINAINNTIENKKPTTVEYSITINNETRYFEARNLYFSKERVAIFIREISERKRAEILVKEEFKKLKELEQIRKDLISRFSHELKTPLIPLISGAELLTTIYKDDIKTDQAIEIIELINKGGIRLKELINKLLDVTRIEADRLTLNKQNTDFCQLIRECSKDMKYLMEKRQITLHLNIPKSFYIDLDKVRIDEVVRNLLSNAIKNTPPNGNVKIYLHKQHNWAFLTVYDTGVGFTEKEMELLFTRFGKIERDQKGLEYLDIQGSGLGLFITKNIVELHNGKIWAESSGRHKGSKFIVKLPIN
jgi:PAS domain S-box-containing protein